MVRIKGFPIKKTTMKFDTIIIGGGLAGLVCGIRLQKAGQNTCIVSSGQSALHFSSGSFDMLDRTEAGEPVSEPLAALPGLSESHPYSIIGEANMKKYVSEIKPFFASCGVNLCGDAYKNGLRISPTGDFCPAWLAIDDYTLIDADKPKIADKVLIVNIFGYLDFNTGFIARSLEEKGVSCRVVSVKLEEMERLRKNPSEMRATNIARVMDREEVCDKLIAGIAAQMQGEDLIVLPAVFGLRSTSSISRIREAFNVKLHFVATMPPSVPGIRTQMRLRTEYEHLGGTYLLGDTVNSAEMSEDSVLGISTVNFVNIRMKADNYVLASGSFFSKGLIAVPDKVYEPVFGLDVDYSENRAQWCDSRLFAVQNYISFGVGTDSSFRPRKNNVTFNNLYAIGSVLGGYNALAQGCGAGVAVFSALYVADEILKKEKKDEYAGK